MKKLSVALTTITILSLLTTIISVGSILLWSAAIQLSNDIESDYSPAVMQDSNGEIWIVWHTFRTGNADLWYKISDGSGWPRFPTQLTDDSGNDVNPAILRTSTGAIWLVWASDRTGDYEIFYKNSSNNGLSWSAEMQLTSNASSDRRPSIAQAQNDDIWIAWHSDRTGNEELFYKVYNMTDGTWGADTQLTYDPDPDRGPSVMQAEDDKLWVFWAAYRTENFDIFYKTYNGTWSLETRLTTHSNWDQYPSSLQGFDGKIWVFWQSNRQGQDFEIYYQFSSDNGSSWSGDTQLDSASDPKDDILPSTMQAANKTIWVTWASSRLDDFEIFYSLASNEHDVGITNITQSSIYVYRDYGIRLYVEVRNYGLYTETFTVTAYYNNTAIGTQTVTNLAPSEYEMLVFQWTATGVPLGNYTISSFADFVADEDSRDNSPINGIVYVRIPGDVNGDRNVNVLDAILLTKYFGKYSEYPAADINGDDVINLFDALILTTNFGETG